ncbi:hypothetical protein E1293_29275 [Actinomadura darangshiensis]|uniref:Uncharacterized protein n=1 Tax=Actinomadura darangshiensis TaxID=705336 RepID=A0A4R5AQW8_9ACTN|nr:hypothetical protein [Actinomadura darangshiensis]TDD74595.1 hypothetical protein E1293_29275 [Actinomadura darangshiensis]
MTDQATAPEIRLTAHIFERTYGTPPATTRHFRGALPLLDGVDVPLPWGAAVAAARSDGATSLYSMNHHSEGVVPASTTAAWARPCVEALHAYADPATRLVVNRELPAATGLFTGFETLHATALALQDLYGEPEEPVAAPPPMLWDLSRSGLRLLVIDVGARHPAAVPPADPDLAGRAATVLLEGRPADLGPLLTDAHSPGNPAHDDALEAALDAGALGGRTVGACMVALTPVDDVLHIREQVTARLTPNLPRPPRYLTI